ncbi:MAG: hypothetical protein IPO08_21855 [Xanthomonadales bacterium]|nr:hypothetical protein [Xanthomonadales bacterium]
MSLWSSIKRVGRAIDPTNAKAPLGSILAKGLDGAGAAFGVPPGTISTGLAMAGAANASRPGGAAAPEVKPAPVDPLKAAVSPSSPWGQFATGSGGLALAAAAVLALVLLLKRK